MYISSINIQNNLLLFFQTFQGFLSTLGQILLQILRDPMWQTLAIIVNLYFVIRSRSRKQIPTKPNAENFKFKTYSVNNKKMASLKKMLFQRSSKVILDKHVDSVPKPLKFRRFNRFGNKKKCQNPREFARVSYI